MSIAKETEFKGMPLFAIHRDPQDQYPFMFGVKKPKLILDHVEEIKAFHKKHSETPED